MLDSIMMSMPRLHSQQQHIDHKCKYVTIAINMLNIIFLLDTKPQSSLDTCNPYLNNTFFLHIKT